MEIIAWNIRWGGQDRLSKVARVIRERDPDVVVLTEYQPRGSAPLLADLAAAGWLHQLPTEPPERRGGVAIASKMPLVPRPRPSALEPFASRYLPVGIPEANLELRAIYAPLEDEPYDEYWAAVLDALASEIARQCSRSAISTLASQWSTRQCQSSPLRGSSANYETAAIRTSGGTIVIGRITSQRGSAPSIHIGSITHSGRTPFSTDLWSAPTITRSARQAIQTTRCSLYD